MKEEDEFIFEAEPIEDFDDNCGGKMLDEDEWDGEDADIKSSESDGEPEWDDEYWPEKYKEDKYWYSEPQEDK